MEKRDLHFMQNREFSSLEFNKRVLEEALDNGVPVLERLKFISIFTSNTKEFFMVRVGNFIDMLGLKNHTVDVHSAKIDSSEELITIFDIIHKHYKLRDTAYKEVETQLRLNGIFNLKYHELAKNEKKYLDNYFYKNFYPVLSPLVINASHPFPHITDDLLCIVATLVDRHKNKFHGIVNIPSSIPSFVVLPGFQTRYILTEEIILEYVAVLFEKFIVISKATLAVTRNADINLDEEIDVADSNLRQQIKKALKKRLKMAPVRLEIQGELPKNSIKYLRSRLNLHKNQIYFSKAPLKMGYTYILEKKISKELRKSLVFASCGSFFPYSKNSHHNIMKQILKKDCLTHFPYQSMEPFLLLLKEAADDTSVISIKITIYRLAAISKVAEYLARAAENGKEIFVLMELRARFDEDNNINWSERLEQAGCTIIYGFEDYKVHAKICLITYHKKGEFSYITQIGTGNYNEKTAKQYTDFSLMTSNKEIGKDAALFFKNMLISNLFGQYKHLISSPMGIKHLIITMLEKEMEKVNSGGIGKVFIKCNAVTEREVINKLVEASQAGVKINMLVRGICCILPGVKGKTDNITIRSIVGRYLEHHRFYIFGDNNQYEQMIYISSADLMTRNLDKRVELACPIYDADVQEEIREAMAMMWADGVKSKELQSDGRYIPTKGDPNMSCQDEFLKIAEMELTQVKKHKQIKKTKQRKTFKI